MKTPSLVLALLLFIVVGGYAQTNTNLGTNAGNSGTENTSIGNVAGDVVTGDYNSFIGSNSGNHNTMGYRNTFLGYASGFSTTTGYTNVFVGNNSGYSNGNGIQNVFLGSSAGYANTTGLNNVYIGESSGFSNLSGARNTFLGQGSGYFTTSSDNTFLGYLSGKNTSTGSFNTFTGVNSGLTNTTGSYNTAHGYQALYSTTTASYNLAIGQESLYANTTGNSNTGLGYRSLYTNTTGTNNTAIGYLADVFTNGLTNATAIGSSAVVASSNSIQLGNSSVTQVFVGTGTTATLLTGGLKVSGGTPGVGKVLTSDAFGTATWQAPTTAGWALTGNAGTVDGTNFIGTTDNVPFNIRVNNQKAGRIDPTLGNVFYGGLAGQSTVTGGGNVANGYSALFSNFSGNDNVAIGSWVMQLGGGSNNTGVGAHALQNGISGNNNTAVGYSALYSNTGNYNTAVGDYALNNNTSGNANSAFGDSAGPNTTNLSNTTALGYGATTTASNQVRIGSSGVSSIGGQVGWSTLSDGRFKKDVKADVSGLSFINELKPVSYVVDKDAFNKFLGLPEERIQKLAQSRVVVARENGFIAQDIEALIKEKGYVFYGVEAPQNERDHYSIRYAEFVVPLVKAVQELSAKVDEQQAKLLKQQETINLLTSSTGKSGVNDLPGKTETVLFQNNPNPFSSDTKIEMAIAETSRQAKLMVYNLEGKELMGLEVPGRGNTSATISSGQLSAGMYIYALIVDGKVIDSKRMILTR